MWRRNALVGAAALTRQFLQPCRHMASSRPSPTASVAVNSMILRSLKDHYLDESKMTPPPKISPPAPYTVVKGALDRGGPVLKGTYKNEEISMAVMRLVDIVPEDDNIDETINQLFVHINISKPNSDDSLHFLCSLYPEALSIHSVSLRPKAEDPSEVTVIPKKYTGPVFEEVDEKVRDAFQGYIEERGINEKLFPFLQAWLYVKDNRNLMRWFKTVGNFVNESNQANLQA